jgi:thioredoxin reductase
VVGGGNSAGQAAVFLAGVAKHVHHIVRGPSLESTMSQYLVSRIDRAQPGTVRIQFVLPFAGESGPK